MDSNSSKIPLFSIVTPCFNAEDLIGETIESVVTQSAVNSGKVQLEYIICDGGSTDTTLDVVKSFKNNCIHIISGPDNGMYDALSKGLSAATGDIVAYLNAGDYYHKTAFDVVVEIMRSGEVGWLTGLSVFYNSDSQVISCKYPFRFRKSYISAGLYGPVLPYIQQESTFWKKELNDLIDFNTLAQYKFAGDYFIWNTFASRYKLYIVYSFLGGFKIHKGQLSEEIEFYNNELHSITKPNFIYKILAFLEKPLWFLPPSVKKTLNVRGIFKFDLETNRWN